MKSAKISIGVWGLLRPDFLTDGSAHTCNSRAWPSLLTYQAPIWIPIALYSNGKLLIPHTKTILLVPLCSPRWHDLVARKTFLPALYETTIGNKNKKSTHSGAAADRHIQKACVTVSTGHYLPRSKRPRIRTQPYKTSTPLTTGRVLQFRTVQKNQIPEASTLTLNVLSSSGTGVRILINYINWFIDFSGRETY